MLQAQHPVFPVSEESALYKPSVLFQKQVGLGPADTDRVTESDTAGFEAGGFTDIRYFVNTIDSAVLPTDSHRQNPAVAPKAGADIYIYLGGIHGRLLSA